MEKWRVLRVGEIIRHGDQVLAPRNWDENGEWVFVRKDIGSPIGQPAPDPRFVGHRMYRRRVCNNEQAEVAWNLLFAALESATELADILGLYVGGGQPHTQRHRERLNELMSDLRAIQRDAYM